MKINILMFAVVFGIGGAFAFKPQTVKIKANETEYFAVQSTPGHYTWETSLPEGVSCSSGNATCKISTSETPINDQLPSSYTVLEGEDGASLNR